MSKQREALDALEGIHPGNMTPMAEQAWNKAINAIREALAEPEQEPVAWLSEGGDVSRSKRYMDEMGFICEPLYTAPPARKPLTDEEIERLLFESHRKPGNHRHNFARLIEQAHGIGGE